MSKKMVYLVIVFMVFTINCTTTKKIQKNVNIASSSLEFTGDSTDFALRKKNINVLIDTIIVSSDLINHLPQVNNTGGWYLPLIVFHTWKLKKEISLGTDNIEQDLSEFVKESLVSEINNTTLYNSNYSNPPDYKLLISIDSLNSKGPYINKGFYFYIITGYAYGYKDIAGPAVTNVSITYKLLKDNEIILTNTLYSSSETPSLSNEDYGNIKVLQLEYITSMIESVSYNLNNLVKETVQEVSDYFDTQN